MDDSFESNSEIILLKKSISIFEYITTRFAVIVVLILSLVGITLVIYAASLLIESWSILLGRDGEVLISAIGAVGAAAVGYAVLDLAGSILREELAEEKAMEIQHRSRDFITRILTVVVIALAVGTFVNETKYSATTPELLWQVSTIGIAIAAILVGWGLYLKLSKK